MKDADVVIAEHFTVDANGRLEPKSREIFAAINRAKEKERDRLNRACIDCENYKIRAGDNYGGGEPRTERYCAWAEGIALPAPIAQKWIGVQVLNPEDLPRECQAKKPKNSGQLTT